LNKTYEDSQKITFNCIYIQVIDIGYRKKMESSLILLMREMTQRIAVFELVPSFLTYYTPECSDLRTRGKK